MGRACVGCMPRSFCVPFHGTGRFSDPPGAQAVKTATCQPRCPSGSAVASGRCQRAHETLRRPPLLLPMRSRLVASSRRVGRRMASNMFWQRGVACRCRGCMEQGASLASLPRTAQRLTRQQSVTVGMSPASAAPASSAKPSRSCIRACVWRPCSRGNERRGVCSAAGGSISSAVESIDDWSDPVLPALLSYYPVACLPRAVTASDHQPLAPCPPPTRSAILPRCSARRLTRQASLAPG